MYFQVGTNLMSVYTSKRVELTIRELGGCMAPIWHNYYQDCDALIVRFLSLFC